MKRYILTLLAIISLIAVSATNQTSQKNGTQTSPEVDELLSEDEVLSGEFRLPDDIYLEASDDAPMLLSWFQDTTSVITLENGNKLMFTPVEVTDLYTKEKRYYISVKAGYNINNIEHSITILITKEEASSIIKALNRISEYVPCESISENIIYEKSVPLYGVNIEFKFSYDYKKDKWDCFFVSSANGALLRTSKGGSYENGFIIHGKLKDTWSEIHRIICSLNDGIKNLDERKSKVSCRYLVEECLDDGNVYYWDKYKNVEAKLVNAGELDIYYDFEKNYKELNDRINKIIHKNQSWIKSLNRYGTIEVNITRTGELLYPKLKIRKDLTEELSKRTIAKILDTIDEFKFLSYNKKVLSPQFKIILPLTME